jgi:hypothetical protein
MHDYCMARDDLDYLLDVTKFKTKGAWNDDPLKGVPTALKSAFTRCAWCHARAQPSNQMNAAAWLVHLSANHPSSHTHNPR